jgi:hypothetical protein
MGRYINTALGQRWSDEPHPNEPGHLSYPPRTLHALGRIAGKVDHALAMTTNSPTPPKVTEDPPGPKGRSPAEDPRITT